MCVHLSHSRHMTSLSSMIGVVQLSPIHVIALAITHVCVVRHLIATIRMERTAVRFVDLLLCCDRASCLTLYDHVFSLYIRVLCQKLSWSSIAYRAEVAVVIVSLLLRMKKIFK